MPDAAIVEGESTRRCGYCRKALPRERRTNRVYCGGTCRSAAGIQRGIEAGRLPVRSERADGLNAGDAGALAELVVTVDLMRRGWHVFRAVSPASPCDLVIVRGATIRRVEVRMARKTSLGEFQAWTSRVCQDRHDVLALVCGVEIEYRPAEF
jgi:hypothetical protein